MAILQPHNYDVFLSYAHDDNVIHDDAVRMFRKYFRAKFRAEIRLRMDATDEPEIFMDINGLPANGELTGEIRDAIFSSAFLIIFVGKAYPRSSWCGEELRLFANRFPNARKNALKRTFVIVLDKSAEKQNWGTYLESPERPIFSRFYDDESGHHFPPMLEDPTGQAVPGPRFLNGIQKVAVTMADRAISENLENSKASHE